MKGYRIDTITDKDLWNDFLFAHQDVSNFLLSWEWGEFNEKKGRQIYRLGIYDNELVGICQVVKKKLFLNFNYLDIERGYLSFKDKQGIFNFLLSHIAENIKDKNTVFLRASLMEDVFKNGFVKPKILTRLHPPHQSAILDISQDEEYILSHMHPKMRYNIKKAIQKKVEVREIGFDDFYDLLLKTSRRQGIKIFPSDHYKNILSIKSRDLDVRLWGACIGSVVAAGIMNIYFGNCMFYLHGGMDYEYRKYFPSHLLHFEAIKEAHSRGYRFYDLWGIDISGENKLWKGITRFKMQFGDSITLKIVNYPLTLDLVYKKTIYLLASMAKFFKA